MPICCLPGCFSCWDFSKVIMPFLLSTSSLPTPPCVLFFFFPLNHLKGELHHVPFTLKYVNVYFLIMRIFLHNHCTIITLHIYIHLVYPSYFNLSLDLMSLQRVPLPCRFQDLV